MIELKGKYNTAKVFTDNIDNETISQVVNLLNQESMKDSKIRIMPDTHAGAGCVIGTTMTLTDKVIPNLVGVDIGCGMKCVHLKNLPNPDYKELDRVIREHVPSGFNIREQPSQILSTNNRLLSNQIPTLLNKIKAPFNESRAILSGGTLGGGNHFIELDSDGEDGYYLVIHTGSRYLGKQVAEYYQDAAWKNIKQSTSGDKIQNIIEKLKAEGKYSEIENAIKNYKSKDCPVPKELCYCENELFDNYMHDIKLVQEYASVNREIIAMEIMENMDWMPFYDAELSFTTIHNYIDTERNILRKGSVSAEKGERLIIPINMRDGSLICIGKGNSDWNYSAPHGAGRLLSRSKAKELIQLEDYKESMTGIWTSCVNTSTIDESPFAYKPMEEIIENIQDTCIIENIITPVYNYKASEMTKELDLSYQEDKER